MTVVNSFHIGKVLKEKHDFEAIVAFFEAIGFRITQRTLGDFPYISFSGPEASFGFGKSYADQSFLDIGVFDTETAYQIAKKRSVRILRESADEPGQRVFTLEFPGGTHIVIHPVSDLGGLQETLVGKLAAQGKKFAVVVSRFNSFITERLFVGARDALLLAGADRANITIVRVPGSFEIPSAARTLAETGKYDAIICLGCLLRGDTAHYDVIVNEVTRGIGQSAQETGVPHAFGVLTCDTLEQAIDRAGLKMGNKGFEAALAAVEMANLKKAVSSQPSAISEKRKPIVAAKSRKR